MKNFKTFIAEASIRQGLPHITTMDHDQFSRLVHGGKIKIENPTEKTDGSTMKIGYDQHGFYTQNSGSGDERMREPSHYIDRASRRAKETGKDLDLTAPNAFAEFHAMLQKNGNLQSYLKKRADESGGETAVRGEAFMKRLSRPSEEHPGEIKFVGTSYDPSHMGSVGKFVVHSKLPENQGHDVERMKGEMSTPELNFDHDKIENVGKSAVDVRKETSGLENINKELLSSRTTPKNKEEKMAEMAKLDAIKKRVSDKVDDHVKSLGISPKWGSGTEGLVVHPPQGSDAPRFKVTSDTFRAYKADPENKLKFKQRTQVK
jgi:hypothetical protein